jgi:hypothetical protein
MRIITLKFKAPAHLITEEEVIDWIYETIPFQGEDHEITVEPPRDDQFLSD